MTLYSEDNVTDALETILRSLRKVDANMEGREQLREDLNELWPDLQQLHGGNAYSRHLTSYIDTEYRRLHEPEGDEEPREKPLCGCSSPTCPLKEGELPASATVDPNSTIGGDDLENAVAATIQSHTKPYVLEEAAEQWHTATGGVLVELYEIKADAVYLLNKQRGTIHE